MTFTDNDLKRLKDQLRYMAVWNEDMKIDALLARLEAAEAILDCHIWGYCGKCKVDHEEEWRKVAGK